MNNQDLDLTHYPTFSCDSTELEIEVVNAIKSEAKYSNDKLLVKFIKSFYSYIPIDYIENYNANFFKDTALSAYEFFLKKPINKNYLVTISQFTQSSEFPPFIEFKIINIDAAFIIDSIKSLLERIGLEPFFFIHPIVITQRSKDGKLVDVHPALQSRKSNNITNSNIESLIVCKIHGTFDKKLLDNIKNQLTTILEQINKTSADWQPILQKIEKIIISLSRSSDQEEKSIIDFLHWLKADNFTFLSCINYNIANKKSKLIAGHKAFFHEQDVENIVHLACNQHNDKKLILIGKINKPSTVHKSSFINYVLIKQKDQSGNLNSAMIFLGLYSASTRQQSVQNIPILLDKLKDILSFSKFSSSSYNAKRFNAIFESLPREMLFEASSENLYCACLKVLSAMHNNALRLCLFPNCLNNIIDIIVFLPSARLTPNVHANITGRLIKAFNTKILSSELNTVPPNFCSIYISMSVDNNTLANLNIKELESDLENLSAQWIESFKASLIKSYGLFEGLKLFKDNACIFPKNYIQNFNSTEAVNDLKYVIQAQKSAKKVFNFIVHSQHIYSLKIYNPGSKLPLSQIFPLIENLNFNILDEQTFKISAENGRPLISQLALDSNKQEPIAIGNSLNVQQDLNALYSMNNNQSDTWIYNFNLSPKIELTTLNLEVMKKNVEAILEKITTEVLEYDVLYKLTTLINIDVYQVRLLQALVHYLQQIKFAYSKDYVKSLLIKHYQFTNTLLKLFDYRFNPHAVTKHDINNIEQELLKHLNLIGSSAEDKVLRTMLALVKAISRTNYYHLTKNGNHKNYLSFKIKSQLIPDLPLPVPYAEIFVFSNEFEGIHLRGGKVARGGIRWSDRGEDYRTEVLGLMKAQMTKNTIIVPVGSKGGFFVKVSPESTANASSYQKLAVECYKNFLRGLLDITDNTVAEKILSPENTAIQNEDYDDPYLVVAADKGTASFSDHANKISQEYDFWLRDAFASGGSDGYDHKKMGITAKGAWISVQHHFKHLGVDVQKDTITVVGIGDMSGDVFGNGMLRSDTIKLVGAFNHMHIFVDPNPDPKQSYQERLRLFQLPNSKWSDYDPKVLSKGGGVFSRSAKIIKLSSEAQQLFNLSKNEVKPEELIKALLKAKVDLIWNGGIGTYIKASDESMFDIGDKSNDALRCNAKDISAKVIAEGGNLGISQRGRIEYARQGGRINTDFIDNSAGVECSDHEVNIKIALNNAMAKNKLTLKERNKILEQMSPMVEKLVLVDNHKQNQAITITEKSKLFTMEMFTNTIKTLEQAGLLDRTVEFLPSDNEIAQRSLSKEKMTRPELAILLSYSKMHTYAELIKTDLASEPFLSKYLLNYFPELMQKRFYDEISTHPLRKEIILTVLSNKVINQISGPILNMIQNDTKATLDNIVKAYVITNEIFSIDELWQNIDDLGTHINNEVQVIIFSEINKLIRRGISWFIQNTAELDITKTINIYKKPTVALAKKISSLSSSITAKAKDKFDYYISHNIPPKLATHLSNIDYLISVLDIILVSVNSNSDYNKVAKTYFAVGEVLSLYWLRKCCDQLISDHYWNRLAIRSLKEDLYNKQRRLLSCIITTKQQLTFDRWWQKNKANAVAYLDLINEIAMHKTTVDLHMIVLANKKCETFLNKVS